VIEVFKTNVQGKRMAQSIVGELLLRFPQAKINFDLHDCDKILRIECLTLCVDHVVEVLKNKGFYCEVLD